MDARDARISTCSDKKIQKYHLTCYAIPPKVGHWKFYILDLYCPVLTDLKFVL